VSLSLAEKIDTLVGFFSIDEKPTGSKDPFALRRAALGIIRLITENNIRIELDQAIRKSASSYDLKFEIDDLLNFFWDRLKVYAKDRNIRHDIIGAEFNWDYVCLLSKAQALQNFVVTDDGENLLAGYKRAANILKAEEKKDGVIYKGDLTADQLTLSEEKTLYASLNDVTKKTSAALQNEDFELAMTALSGLRTPIDDFFDKVTVNSDNKSERESRLKLLSHIRTTMNSVVEFSKIEG
jgi:glycyl-tRNA synthetase beta chain